MKITQKFQNLVIADNAAYLSENRSRWHSQTEIVLAPRSAQDVQDIVRYCAAHKICITTQGGNTGLVGGQMPQTENSIILSMHRMNRIRDISASNNSIACDAGVILQHIQQAASDIDRLFPVSIGAEGSCQIGGIISTNAGGVNVLKYGNTRDQILGLEVVLPNGEIWDGMNGLRKNNTGYDLKHLFIGGEGTLGVVTGAVLALQAKPNASAVFMLATETIDQGIGILRGLQREFGHVVSSFEMMSRNCVDLIAQHTDNKVPQTNDLPYVFLIELERNADDQLLKFLEGLGNNVQNTLVLAQHESQAEKFWAIRHAATEAMKRDPAYCVKCDVSMPIDQISSFLIEAYTAIHNHHAGVRIIDFGHIGDGNIHYDILGPIGEDPETYAAKSREAEDIVHDIVMRKGGSFSAEHGIGQLKIQDMKKYKSAVELDMMRGIKRQFDPDSLFNPHVLF